MKKINHDDILALAIENATKKIGMPTHLRKILPVKYRNGGPDCTYPDVHSLQVTIGNPCKVEEYRAYYQLAHEAIHTLSPVDKCDVSILEEGAATMLSHKFLAQHTEENWPSSGDDKYDEAWKKVEELIAIDPDALAKIYTAYKTLSHITTNDILRAVPNAPHYLADVLAAKFN